MADKKKPDDRLRRPTNDKKSKKLRREKSVRKTSSSSKSERGDSPLLGKKYQFSEDRRSPSEIERKYQKSEREEKTSRRSLEEGRYQRDPRSKSRQRPPTRNYVRKSQKQDPRSGYLQKKYYEPGEREIAAKRRAPVNPQIYEGRKIYERREVGKSRPAEKEEHPRRYEKPLIQKYSGSGKPSPGLRGCFIYCQEMGCGFDICPTFGPCGAYCLFDMCGDEGCSGDTCTNHCFLYS